MYLPDALDKDQEELYNAIDDLLMEFEYNSDCTVDNTARLQTVLSMFSDRTIEACPIGEQS
jgi:hypothetical protein